MNLLIQAIKPKPSKQPFWFNKKANKLVAKHKKHKIFKQTKDLFFSNKYKLERRKHKAELQEIEQEYITNMICKPLETRSSKPFYHHLKQAQGVTKPPMKLITTSGPHTETPSECANILNELFGSQFCKQHILNVAVYSHAGSSKQIEVSVDGVLQLLKSLKNGKSPGPDEIRKEDLIIDPVMTAKCLTAIFQASLPTLWFPTEWKLAHVTPLHKRGPTDQPNNYRPISSTNISCKILDHIVLHHLNIILDKVLYNRQHGFRKGLCYETQLCKTYHEIAKHID